LQQRSPGRADVRGNQRWVFRGRYLNFFGSRTQPSVRRHGRSRKCCTTSPFHGVCRSALRPRPRFSTPSTRDITRVDDTGTRRPPRATFGCLHAPPGAKRGLGAEEICGPLPPCRKTSLRSLQTATDRGLRRYSPPPARSHASLHPFGPCPHLVIHSSVLSGPMACPAAAGFARAALGRPRPPLPAVARRSAAGCQVRLHDLSEPLAIQPRGDGEARAAAR
jgi:hypothetical protein